MAKLKWAITCQRVITDRETNLVSYIDGVEEIHVPAVPFPLPPIVVGTVWHREKIGETIHLRIKGVDPSGNVFTEIPASLESPDKLRHRANFTIGTTVQHLGTHRFVVEQRVSSGEWRFERELSVDVLQLATTGLPPPPKKLQDADLAPSTPSRKRKRRTVGGVQE